MRRFDSPYTADWFATSLRWLVLVALSLSLALRGQLGELPFWVLAVMVVWNAALSVLAGINVRMMTPTPLPEGERMG